MDIDRVLREVRVEPGRRAGLAQRPTDWREEPELRRLNSEELEARARSVIAASLEDLRGAQEMLWADDRWSLLVVLQAMDAAGKDGAIKHVMSGVNPQGCSVHPFKAPSAEELDHTFLWRCMKAAPARGQIVIFNRSHYEEVLVARVHPEVLERQRLPEGKRGRKFWQERFEDINAFERHMARNGVRIVKFFLHISKGEQKKRLLARLDDPDKRWKFDPGDVSERRRWDDYMEAYEDAITQTSTEWAPWHVVPADHKWVSRAILASVIAHEIRALDLSFPSVGPEQRRRLEQARLDLESE
ncbi:MAG: polyphosphate kinase 2 family protein [Phycisphaerales bacterium]|nr:polyphosphate kinase 2 family protein [Phycisphaerales bacterium]